MCRCRLRKWRSRRLLDPQEWANGMHHVRSRGEIPSLHCFFKQPFKAFAKTSQVPVKQKSAVPKESLCRCYFLVLVRGKIFKSSVQVVPQTSSSSSADGTPTWVWVKIQHRWFSPGFSLCFHLPGFRFGYLFLTHSHVAWEADGKMAEGPSSFHFAGYFEKKGEVHELRQLLRGAGRMRTPPYSRVSLAMD